MPPGPLYNWLCVLHSVSEIVSHAAAIRATRLTRASPEVKQGVARTFRPGEKIHIAKEIVRDTPRVKASTTLLPGSGVELINNEVSPPKSSVDTRVEYAPAPSSPSITGPPTSDTDVLPSTRAETTKVEQNAENTTSLSVEETVPQESTSLPSIKTLPPENEPEPMPSLSQTQRNLRASKVPSSRIGRLFHYGGLAASLGYGAASEALRRVSSSSQEEGGDQSLMMTSANITRLVEKLSRMRGAALKLGQFMSIQDTYLLPKDVEDVFRRVQDSAHYMPNWQMEHVLNESLGDSWATLFDSFDPIPFAAASLGQVHRATLTAHASPTGEPAPVAVKVQFPDIARSIESDLGYLKLLLGASRVLPKGLFLDKTLRVMKEELKDECDYKREASCARFFREEGMKGDEGFRVPWVWEGSSERVLVMELMEGVSVGGNVVDMLSQDSRDKIATMIVELCMKELFVFRMMQTDPNWSNFLWNERTKQIELIDFGATRSYSAMFIDKWMHMLRAAVSEDHEACVYWSQELGYLTGEEGEEMVNAHVKSLVLLASPFRRPSLENKDVVGGVVDEGKKEMEGGLYSFGKGTEWARITKEIRSLIPIMLNQRLTPPPQETYSLNRKLSGAFLLASRLRAKVDTRGIWERTSANYRFSDSSSWQTSHE